MAAVCAHCGRELKNPPGRFCGSCGASVRTAQSDTTPLARRDSGLRAHLDSGSPL
jgi:hypothetical protein